jgi:hypothetical protein
MKTIEEKKNLIAEFIEMQKTNTGWFDKESVLKLPYTTVKTFDTLSFDVSWDWLMPVVEKISNLNNWSLNVTLKWLSQSKEKEALYNIEDVFDATVKFIEWYNEKNKNE